MNNLNSPGAKRSSRRYNFTPITTKFHTSQNTAPKMPATTPTGTAPTGGITALAVSGNRSTCSSPTPAASTGSNALHASVPTICSKHVSSPSTSVYAPLIDRGYIIKDTIGIGGYSKVKLATRRHTKEKVAIKVVSKKNAPEGYLEKFLPREVRALAMAKHKHVTRIYEMLDTPDHVFLVMEYASGGDLLEYINKGGALSEDRARYLFYQLMDALSFCHCLGICHRDLKCENILLNGKGDILVSDFGFATIVDSPDAWLMTHCGSYAYAAPEILDGRPYHGQRSDIWSLGVVLYAMTCGRLPFRDKTIKMLLEDIRKGLEFPRALSRNLQDFIRSILTPNVDKRATFDQLLQHPWMSDHAQQFLPSLAVKVLEANGSEPSAEPECHAVDSASIADCASDENLARDLDGMARVDSMSATTAKHAVAPSCPPATAGTGRIASGVRLPPLQSNAQPAPTILFAPPSPTTPRLSSLNSQRTATDRMHVVCPQHQAQSASRARAMSRLEKLKRSLQRFRTGL
eukprot:m.124069 g.124069  ORF g.124069 m.124069 type:complete len:517 (-) comp15583_c1_seq2:152-1702(-)